MKSQSTAFATLIFILLAAAGMAVAQDGGQRPTSASARVRMMAVPAPGSAVLECKDGQATLGNSTLSATWRLGRDGLRLAAFNDRLNGEALSPDIPAFAFELGDGRTVSAAGLVPAGGFRTVELPADPAAVSMARQLAGKALELDYELPAANLRFTWRASLRTDGHYIRQELVFQPLAAGVVVRKTTLGTMVLKNAEVAGAVRGVPVTTGTLFMGVEHPSACAVVKGRLGWSPSDFQQANTPTLLKFPMADVIAGPGDYSFRFRFMGGRHRLDIFRVRIWSGDKVLAEEVHHGIAGVVNEATVYKARIGADGLAPNMVLEVQASTDGGVDSNGVIAVEKDGMPVPFTAKVECFYERNSELPVSGRPFTVSSILGVAPSGQMRRAFNCYIERERARPYRQFLLYNSWYDLNMDRPLYRMTEADMLDTIRTIGEELTVRRGVKLDSYVLDDGWDDHRQVYVPHDGFPDGFDTLSQLARKYGAGLGVWLSPWGGYSSAKQKRLEAGRKLGFEINRNGFSMAGTKYRQHFQETCLAFIKRNKVNYFKFDGIGGSPSGDGDMADGSDSGPFAADMEAIFDMCRELRKADPDLFLSATAGTWPSPFWLLHADSTWRQGHADVGFEGAGNRREQWITFRDHHVYTRVVQRSPLYPVQSLMYHGVVIARMGPAKGMDASDLASIRHEVRSFFGSGTDNQELYISPSILSPAAWDAIAEAAVWAKRNEDCLVDSHFIGGDPGRLEPYGFASWIPGKGVLVLRNPSDKPQAFQLDIGTVFELPAQEKRAAYALVSPYKDQSIQKFMALPGKVQEIALRPFEVLVFEAIPLSSN